VAESGGLLPGLGEKVLGVRSAWHRSHSLEHSRLIRSLSQACVWLADPGNRAEAVEIIASKRYVNTPKTVVEGALQDAAARALSKPAPGGMPDRFDAGGPNLPAQIHAKWYLDQMRRWGHMDATLSAGIDLSSICLEGFYQSITASLSSFVGQNLTYAAIP
jgi:ABC-type nitrate/sulfonate/bicarbonate transport system substrate-binding protein